MLGGVSLEEYEVTKGKEEIINRLLEEVRTYIQDEAFEKAIENCEQILLINDKNQEVYFCRGNAYKE